MKVIRTIEKILAISVTAVVMLMFWAASAQAEELDRYALHREHGARVAILEYHNSERMNSAAAPEYVEVEGLRVYLHLRIGCEGGNECLHIMDLPDGWVADQDYVSVPDGETGYIELNLRVRPSS
jgi:hypothetical protein